MPNDKPPKDPWCNPLEMPDGSKISGAPARERRIKLKGGIPAIVDEGVAIALEKYHELQTSLTLPPPSPRPTPSRRPAPSTPEHTPDNLH